MGSEGLPSSILIRTLLHSHPQARDLLSMPLALTSRHLADSLSCKLESLKRRAAHWTFLGLRALNVFFTTTWPGHPVGDQPVTAVNQAQVDAADAVEVGITDSTFAVEGCRRTLDWVDLERSFKT